MCHHTVIILKIKKIKKLIIKICAAIETEQLLT